MRHRRNHVLICPNCENDTAFAKAEKYSSSIDAGDDSFCKIEELIQKLNRLNLLPRSVNLSLFAANDDRFLNLSSVRDTLLTAAGYCDKTLSLDRVQKIMSFGIPGILINEAPCEFIGFDRTNYRYSCIKKEEKVDLGEDYDQSPCYKGYHKKICVNDFSDQNTLLFLHEFYNSFPNIIFDEEKREGIIPLFMYSFFIDFLIYQSYFGDDIFKYRYNYNDKLRKLATGVASDLFEEKNC